MKKERLVAFTDALLAIVMTILVLELEKPQSLDAESLLIVAERLYCYAQSFFWLGSLWIRIHNDWEKVSVVSTPMLWWNLLFLFSASLLPYATNVMDLNFETATGQTMFGGVILFTSVTFIALNRAVARANPILQPSMAKLERFVWLNIVIVSVGILCTQTLYPMTAVWAVLASFVLVMLPSHVYAK